jgi:hypothetical protein
MRALLCVPKHVVGLSQAVLSCNFFADTVLRHQIDYRSLVGEVRCRDARVSY